MISPFVTKDQQKVRDKKRSEDFFKDYFEVCKKHGLTHRAMLQPTQSSLLALLTLVEYKEGEKTQDVV